MSRGHGDGEFRAVFVNDACRRSRELADVMLMGTHDHAKYNTSEFAGNAGSNCSKPASYVTGNTTLSESVCISSDKSAMADIGTAKNLTGVSDSELKEVVAFVGKPGGQSKTLDEVLEEVGMKGKPIHYLLLRDGQGGDADLLGGATDTLAHVRYVEFQYGREGSWSSASFSDLIRQTMAEKDLVCYWKGTDANIWRITDCWFSHYAQNWHSHVACVSASHSDARPLLERMESMFKETLKKEQVFGENEAPGNCLFLD